MKNSENIAVNVSMVSIIGNMILSAFKLFAGITAHSGAMVSDAVHSASDVFSSIIVIIGIKISSKDSDKEHPYGHERMECVSAIILAVILLITGLFIGMEALRNIFNKDFSSLKVPETLALVSAVISIAVKEGMFWYTRHYAKLLKSDALMADAWHHRSDALSSVGAFIGIAGARMGFPVLDPIASLLICILYLFDISYALLYFSRLSEYVLPSSFVCNLNLLNIFPVCSISGISEISGIIFDIHSYNFCIESDRFFFRSSKISKADLTCADFLF